MEAVYYGDIKCQATYKSGKKAGTRCTNGGYWRCGDQIFCGVHSKNKDRVELPKDPNKGQKQAAKLKEQQAVIKAHAQRNRDKGRNGRITLTKFGRYGTEDIEGFLKVFPNFKHQNRKDGHGVKALSPMSLGPVEHNQPGLPASRNLENFHQGSKCFVDELVTDAQGKQVPGPEFYATQRKFFEDETPHRHKKRSQVAFFVWVRQDGTEVHFKYVESRQFYCNFYERLVRKHAMQDIATLARKMQQGYNLQIVGYDARPIVQVPGKTLAERLEIMYLDPKHPFGHELVLFTMLSILPEQYPWRKHKTENF